MTLVWWHRVRFEPQPHQKPRVPLLTRSWAYVRFIGRRLGNYCQRYPLTSSVEWRLSSSQFVAVVEPLWAARYR